MKLNFVLLTVVCLQVSARGTSQKVTIDVSNAPLSAIFKSIEKQTPYIFFYKPALLREGHNVTLHLNDKSVKEVLDECFKDQPLTWYLEDRIITIQAKTAPPATTDVNLAARKDRSILPYAQKQETVRPPREPGFCF